MLRQPGAILLVSCSSVAFQGCTAENRCISMVIILTPLTLFCNYLGSCCASQSCKGRWGLTSLNLRSGADLVHLLAMTLGPCVSGDIAGVGAIFWLHTGWPRAPSCFSHVFHEKSSWWESEWFLVTGSTSPSYATVLQAGFGLHSPSPAMWEAKDGWG